MAGNDIGGIIRIDFLCADAHAVCVLTRREAGRRSQAAARSRRPGRGGNRRPLIAARGIARDARPPHDFRTRRWRSVTLHPWQLPGPPCRTEVWSETCDTLHAHTQVLGKLAVALAPPEPQLQHAALAADRARLGDTPAARARRLRRARRRARPARPRGRRRAQRRARRAHRARARPDGRRGHPRRAAARRASSPAPVEVDRPAGGRRGRSRSTRTTSTRPTTPPRSRPTSPRPTRAALVLAALRAPYRGRSTPVNAWWGSFDLAVSLFSGRPADRPPTTSSCATRWTPQEVAVGWWPGDPRYPRAAFYAYAHPRRAGFAGCDAQPAAARWDATLGEYLLDWDDVQRGADPHGAALAFARRGPPRVRGVRVGPRARRERGRPRRRSPRPGRPPARPGVISRTRGAGTTPRSGRRYEAAVGEPVSSRNRGAGTQPRSPPRLTQPRSAPPVPPKPGSGGQPAAGLLHRDGRAAFALASGTRANVHARRLGGDRDLLAGVAGLRPVRFLAGRLDAGIGQLGDHRRIRTFSALPSCSSTISSRASTARLASRLAHLLLGQLTAVTSCGLC